jgi:hypothetical protein
MGRYGLFTRLAMIVIGAIWAAAGAFLAYSLDLSNAIWHRGTAWIFAIAAGLLCGGLGLLKTGLTPDRPKTFEDEIPDAHPDMGQDDWLFWDDWDD